MYPPVAFHFRVIFNGLSTPKLDIGFQSITGLEAYINTELSNNIDQPKHTSTGVSFSTLVLRRAVVDTKDSPLTQSVFSWIIHETSTPLPEAYIELLDDKHHPYMSWGITNIIPKSWKLGELNAEKSEILIEIIELSYSNIIFDPKEIK